MNVLYILGNGFDKAQGMATSYPEFYKYLTENVKDGSPLLEKMKSAITEDTVLWSDMESGLGEFTSATNNAEEFDSFYFELSEHLQNYLKKENEKFLPSNDLKIKFQTDFTTISKYLGALDKNRYNAFINKYSNSSKDISVITLNYTDTLEKILSLNDTETTKSFPNSNNLRNLIHVHGRLGESIIIGVNDEMQMYNENFRNNDNIKDCMIKLQSNRIMKETRHIQCEKLIANANFIVLMGVSLGDTDLYWWELIGKNLVNRKNIAVIQHIYRPNAILPTQMQKRGRLERQQQDMIMQKMGIKEENRTDELRERLFFTINAPIFKIIDEIRQL